MRLWARDELFTHIISFTPPETLKEGNITISILQVRKLSLKEYE